MQSNITTPDWVKDAVFYQIFPDRFAKSDRFGRNGYPAKPANLQAWGTPPTHHGFMGGDLFGLVEKLDYLIDLGINAIYLNPIFSSASNHRYHTHDYFQVDPILGGNAALSELISTAHRHDIRIILDGVFNHASRGFFQFNHLLECRSESPYADWFHVYEWPLNAYMEHEQPNYAAWFGLHSLPKFNTDTQAVREFLWRVATYWLEQGVDGWRLDVPNEIDDDAFWQEFRRRCKAVNPDAYIVGELWGDARRWLQGDQFDAQMNYNFTRGAFGFFLGELMDQSESLQTGLGHIRPIDGRSFATHLDQIVNHLYDSEIALAQMNVLGTHDTPRVLTMARKDDASVRLLFLCLVTMPGAPSIYYGDEIGLEGRHDPDCRRAFPWYNRSSWDVSFRRDIRRFIALRHETPALRRGDFRILDAGDDFVAFQRCYEGQTAVVAFNRAQTAVSLTIPDDLHAPLPERLVRTGETLFGGQILRLEGHSGRVWAN